ncbi:MAG: potassium channel family protein [Thermoplasmatota archaeon]
MGKYTLKNRFALLILGIIGVVLAGNIGYIIVKTSEGANPTIVDAFYWTLATLTTLGAYPGNVEFTSVNGKILTMMMVLSGVFTLFIGLQIAIGPWIEETMKRALKTKSEPLPEEKHVIVCGYSEIGKEVIRNLKSHNVEFVVITNSSDESKELHKRKIPYVKGDPTKTKTLKKANINSALSLIAVSDDATNAFICLTAKKVNPKVRIVSSIKESHHDAILHRAGATHIVSPKSITGAMIGGKAIGESIIGIEKEDEEILTGLKVEQIKMKKDSDMANKTIRNADIGSKTGVAVVGIWRKGELDVGISPSRKMKPGDIILALGESENLKKFKELVG